MLILVPEGRITDQEDVQYNTASPYVNWFSVWLLLQYLRTEVAGRSSETFLSITRFIPLEGHDHVVRRGRIEGIKALRAQNHVSSISNRRLN